jgi:hypothetical protein
MRAGLLVLLIVPTVLAVEAAGAGESCDKGAIAAFLRPLQADEAALARLREAAAARARVLESEHFVIVYTGRTGQARALADRLEAVYRAHVPFAAALGLRLAAPAAKLPVLFFGLHGEYRAYRERVAPEQRDVLGFYEPAENRTVLFDLAGYPPVARLRAELDNLGRAAHERRAELSRRLRRNTESLSATVIQHEAAHQIHANIGLVPAEGGTPTWLVEGLAELFELPFVEQGATLAEGTNHHRLAEYDVLYGDCADLSAELRRMVGDESSWRGWQDYALAWALTSYLFQRHPKGLGQFVVERAATESGRLAAFERVLGPLDESFAARLADYIESLRREPAAE